MNVRPIYLSLLFFVLSFSHARAQDTTDRKSPWYMTISAGYTSTRAGGSLVDMVQEFNRQFNIKNATQKNGGGFEINVNFQKYISNFVYLKTGLGYIQKQVNPEENSYPLYKDSLKTGYLSIPLVFGVGIPLNKSETFRLVLEAGPCGNIKLIDKSYHGADRAGFKTYPIVLGVQAGGGIVFKLSSSVRMQLLYTYKPDITNTYDESLYWGNPPIRTMSYKLRTHSITVGLQWPL